MKCVKCGFEWEVFPDEGNRTSGFCLRCSAEVASENYSKTGEYEVQCSACASRWALDESEAAQASFQCPDCGTVIVLNQPQHTGRRGEVVNCKSFLPQSKSKWIFVLLMVAYTQTFESVVRTFTEPFTGSQSWRFAGAHGWASVISTVGEWTVLTPIWESMVLVVVIELLRRAGFPTAIQVLVSTFVLALIDGYHWWPHGLGVAPGFLIAGLSYIYWRPVSWRIALVLIIVIHALLNITPATSLVLSEVQREIVSRRESGYAASWDRADKMYAEGDRLIRAGKYSEAAKTLRAVIDIYPFDPNYYISLGYASWYMGDLRNAEIAFRKAISLNQYEWRAWEDLENLLYQQKRFTEALQAGHRALQSAPPYKLPEIESEIKLIPSQIQSNPEWVSGSNSVQKPIY